MEIGNLKFRTEESEKQHLADYQKLQEMIKTLEKELNRQEVECVNIEGNLNETWKKRMKTLQDSHQIDLDQLKKDISRQEEEILKFKKEIPYLRAHIKDLESKVLEKSRAYAMHQQTSQERINAYRKLLGQRLQQCYSLVKSEEKEPRLDLDVIGEILEEFRSIEDKDSCLVCVSETRNCTLFPCGHHVLCMSCASALPCCPVCRQVIADRIKTYS